MEAKVIIIKLREREGNIHKVLSQSCYPCNAFLYRGYGNHAFGRMDADSSNIIECIHQMPEQGKGKFGFPLEEICQLLVVTGMYLVVVTEQLIAKGTCPHGVNVADLCLHE